VHNAKKAFGGSSFAIQVGYQSRHNVAELQQIAAVESGDAAPTIFWVRSRLRQS
jgi:hypothetical protein